MLPCEASWWWSSSVPPTEDATGWLGWLARAKKTVETHESRRRWLSLDEAVVRRLGAATMATGFQGWS